MSSPVPDRYLSDLLRSAQQELRKTDQLRSRLLVQVDGKNELYLIMDGLPADQGMRNSYFAWLGGKFTGRAVARVTTVLDVYTARTVLPEGVTAANAAEFMEHFPTSGPLRDRPDAGEAIAILTLARDGAASMLQCDYTRDPTPQGTTLRFAEPSFTQEFVRPNLLLAFMRGAGVPITLQ